ncbi:MAG TPA: outer membrane protein assembly factor BamD [Longimicrobiaceae bacterium]
MIRTRLFWIRGVLLAFLLAGCAGNQINPAQLTADELYTQAMGFYEAGNLGRALPLMESFVQLHFGDPRAPDVRLELGKAYERRRQYITAASHYQRLVEDYPTSPHALTARFGICHAYYRLSPPPQLDQNYTYSGIAHCESVATNYPNTEEAQKAAEYLEEMRNKLAQKLYDNGTFYMRRRAYDAAEVYLQRVVENFPQTPFAPKAIASLIETYERMGYVEAAEEQREKLLSEYPESPEAQELSASNS